MDDDKVERLRQKLIDGLENRIRPRDEVLMIQKLMAVQLGQSLGEDQISAPLSLVDPDTIEVSSQSGHLQGLQRRYVEAVRRNLKARLEFAQAHDELRSIPTAAPLKKQPHPERDAESSSSSNGLLDLHLEVAELRQRSEKLDIAQKYMEQLEQQPAGTPDFLDPETMYKDCKPLPEVPKELIDGFTMSHDEVTETELQGLLQKLKKTVLRNKLVARKVEQEYDAAQAKDPLDPKTLSPEAKLQALNAVKTTLINWIESQLSKAGDDNGDAVGGTPLKDTGRRSHAVNLDERLAGIQEQYTRHVELRKEIVALMAKRDSVKPSDLDELPSSAADYNQHGAGGKSAAATSATSPPPYAYLLTPYLEKIQALSREQKAAIEEKTHINTSLARQQEDAKLALEHLTQESQLLPKYPAAARNKSPARRNLSFGEATRVSQLGVAKQVEPWIYAADSAKIATLEMVAEKVEKGMHSIDEARGAIDEVCKLLMIDVDEVQQRSEQEQDTAAEDTQTIKSPAKRVAEVKAREEEEQKKLPKTIWSILDGNLGAINE
ncbi:hypothetical protein PG993_001907 [Apiospora rasikravindrae]|uniref:Uncharacterized protein n=1 Tax=Apiospora rasikravindrae TaxID=990691 RepID=A0ABR1UCR0_9PEZI